MIPIKDYNPTVRPPAVTVLVIAICVMVWLWQVSLGAAGQRAVYSFGMIPAVLLGQAELAPGLAVIPTPLTVLTSMFMHGGLWHLAGNMLYLWVFGNNIEDRLGHLRFAGFYLACGFVAAAAQVLVHPSSTVPMVGASGAISGVLGAYLVMFPHARVLVLVPLGFVFLARIKAGWLLAFWFALQLLNATVTPTGGGGIAFWAHVGGFVAGMALALRMRRRVPARRRGPWG